jgi:hypothetical protein
MDYRGGLKAMYNNPNWLLQTSLIGLCALIPIVGQIAVLGYAFESAAYLHKTNREGYPDFDFGRFGAYLGRGIGPFVVGLVFLIVFIPLLIVEQVISFAVGALVGPMQIPYLLPAVSLGLSFVFFIINAIVNVFQTALMIRGGMSGEFSESFRFSFCGEFAKRAGMDAFFAQMYLGLLYALLVIFALVPFWLLFLTTLPAIGIFFLSYAWLCCQMYRSFLTEKGMPFKVKCEVIDQ